MAVRILNRNCEWRIGDDGKTLGFYDRKNQVNYALTNPPAPCAYAAKNGWKTDACAAAFERAAELTLGGGSRVPKRS